MPNMADPHFARTLTYVCEHNDQGALGIVVNRPIDMTLQALFERLSLSWRTQPCADAPIYFGGPVQTDRGFVLHLPAGNWQSTLKVRERRRDVHDRPDHLQGHPRSGRARRGAVEDAGVRSATPAGRPGSSSTNSRRTPGSRSKRRTPSCSTCRPMSACRRRWNCWASTTRGSPTRRDMPEAARLPAAGTVLAFDFGLQRIGVAVGEAELGTAHALPVIAAPSQLRQMDAIERLADGMEARAAGGRAPAGRRRRGARDDAPGRALRAPAERPLRPAGATWSTSATARWRPRAG